MHVISLVHPDGSNEGKNREISRIAERVRDELCIQCGDAFSISDLYCLDSYSDFSLSSGKGSFLFLPIITMSFFSDIQRRKEYEFFVAQEIKIKSKIVFPIICMNIPLFYENFSNDKIFQDATSRKFFDWWGCRQFDDILNSSIQDFCSIIIKSITVKNEIENSSPLLSDMSLIKKNIVPDGYKRRAFDDKFPSNNNRENLINVGIGSYLKEFPSEEVCAPSKTSEKKEPAIINEVITDSPIIKRTDNNFNLPDGECIDHNNMKNDIEIIKKSTDNIKNNLRNDLKIKDLREDSHSNVIIVDSSGRGDYISLSLAAINAGDGAVIYLMPGEYEGCVKIKNNISIIGKGKIEEIRISSNSGCIVEVSGGSSLISVRIENVSILRNERCYSPHEAVKIKNSDVSIKRCNIFNTINCAIHVMKAGRLTLEKSNVASGFDSGVVVSENSDAFISECRIANNKKCGVIIERNSNVIIKSAHIYDSGRSGVLFQFDSIGVIENSHIYSNNHSGVSIYGGASAIMKENHCYKNKRFGVEVIMGAGGVFYGNKAYENTLGPFHACDVSKRYCIVKKYSHK